MAGHAEKEDWGRGENSRSWGERREKKHPIGCETRLLAVAVGGGRHFMRSGNRGKYGKGMVFHDLRTKQFRGGANVSID